MTPPDLDSSNKPTISPPDGFQRNELDYLFEPFERKPYDLFFFSVQGQKYIGRKTPSILDEEEVTGEVKCSLINASMILGIADREQVIDRGIVVFYQRISPQEKVRVFDQLRQDMSIDLYYPYPHLRSEDRREKCAPPAEWIPTPKKVRNLNTGESFIRKYTVNFLSQFDLTKATLFDPACSVGEFLRTIKSHYPMVLTIGQDLSKEMVKYARGKVDVLYQGDAINPALEEESVDFLFLRFLNFDVVTSVQAHELFYATARTCRLGGYIIVFGHTPVLVSSQWFETLGFQVMQRIGYSQKYNSVFQFYVLKKTTRIHRPEISFGH